MEKLASSDRHSSVECEDDEVMKILCLLFLQRMRIKSELGSYKKVNSKLQMRLLWSLSERCRVQNYSSTH